MEPKEWIKQKEYGISAYALKQLIHQAKKEEMEMLKAYRSKGRAVSTNFKMCMRMHWSI